MQNGLQNTGSLRIFTLQLSVMLNAGVSLGRGLEVLAQMEGAMAQVADRLLYAVETGKPLSVGMEELKEFFPPTYRRVIRVGESTGQLLSVLPALSHSLARQLEMRQRLMASLTYPLFVLIVSGLMVSFLLFYQMPRLLTAFGSGPELPWLTRLVLASLKPLGLTVILAFSALFVLTVAFTRSEAFRLKLALWAGRVPRLGDLLFDYALIHVCGDLSLMLSQGVDLSRALRTIRQGGTGWPQLDEKLNQVLDQVLHGEELSLAMHERGFPRLLTLLLRSGEELGKLDSAFRHYSEMGQFRIQQASEAFLQLLEPCLHLVMGFVVGTLVLACFLPIYQSLQQI